MDVSTADVPWVPGDPVTFVSDVEEFPQFFQGCVGAGDVDRLTAVVGGKTT